MSATAAVAGFIDLDLDPPALMGSRCPACGTYCFPRQSRSCPNPTCDTLELDDVHLSRHGRIWSYTNACYQPPPPYRPAETYVPFCIVAVELETERLVVMGQVIAGVDVSELSIGQEVELVVDTLYSDASGDKLVWKWQPR